MKNLLSIMLMKKLLSIMCLVIMIGGIASPFSVLAVGGAHVFQAENVISNVAGVGFYDSSGSSLESISTLGTVTPAVCLRATEWTKYDVSGLDAGMYRIRVYGSSSYGTTLSVSVSGKTAFTFEAFTATSNYYTFNNVTLGWVYLSGGDTLTLLNDGPNAVFLDYFTLESDSSGLSEYMRHSFIAKNIIPGGQGEAYYDAGVGNTLEIDNQAVVLRAEEWSKYNASELSPGQYKLEIKIGGRFNGHISVSADDTLIIANAEFGETGGYTTPAVIDLGMVMIPAGIQTIKISNTDGTTTFYLYEFTLTALPLGVELTFASDQNGSNVKRSFEAGESFWLCGNISNDNYPLSEFKIITAQYSGDGRLLTCSINTFSIPIYESEQVAVGINAVNGANIVKSFVWNIDNIFYLSGSIAVYSGIETHYYVAQDGDDQNTGTYENPFKTLERAQEAVRGINKNMHGDIVVYLDGEFELDKTLAFTERDSGSNGFCVRWEGVGNAVISGGRKVTEWTNVDDTPLWKASVQGDYDFRQFYVNGNRAVRAKSQWFYWAKAAYIDPSGEPQINSEIDGFVIDGADFPAPFSKPTDLEFVWLPSWRNIRMPVSEFFVNSEGDYTAVFPQPYFDASFFTDKEDEAPLNVNMPFYIENAPEFLDEPGEWYFNKENRELFYYPLSAEDMNEADCTVPVVETLLTINGESGSKKATNIAFSGITFCYGAWQSPSEKGFAPIQAEQISAPDDPEAVSISGMYPSKLMPAQLQVNYADGVSFTDNAFEHLGSQAVSLNNMTTNSRINGNLFDDISASAVTVGDWTLKTDSLMTEFCRNNEIYGNLIRRAAVEYMTPIITAYYVNNVKISHNDIKDAPYTGISLGWGWGTLDPLHCADNEVSGNRIENAMYKTADGGHIYTVGAMPRSVISDNYMIKTDDWKGGIYHDAGSAYITDFNNVIEDVPRWLKLTYFNIHDNTAHDNYSETPFFVTYPDDNNIDAAIGKTGGAWPAVAQAIIESAGLPEEYSGLLAEYQSRIGLRNAELSRLKYATKPGIIIPAANIMQGGEGVAYHEIDGTGMVNGLGITYSYNGTGHKYMMVTKQGEWTKYSVDITDGGQYELVLNLSVIRTVEARVKVDGVQVAYKQLAKNCDDYSVFSDYSMATIQLSPGTHQIQVEHAYNNFGFWSIRLTKQGEIFNRNDGYNAAILDAIIT